MQKMVVVMAALSIVMDGFDSQLPGFYTDSALMMNARGFAAGDLAAAAAALLAGAVVIDGPTPPLTGGAALDLADLAQLAAAILHRPIARTMVTDAAMEARARAGSVPAGVIAVMLGYYRAARAGEFATVDATLAGLLGRAPQTMESVMRASLATAPA